MTMTLIETVTLASSAASIEFTSIPQDGTDLVVMFSGRTDRASASSAVRMTLNSLEGPTKRLEGDGSSASSGSSTVMLIGYVNASTSTSNTFGSHEIYIPNYTSAVEKAVSANAVYEDNTTSARQMITAGLSATTDPIESLSFYSTTGNMVTGSTASLYKITKA